VSELARKPWATLDSCLRNRIKVTGGIVTGLEFSPTDNAISWTCLDGTFSTWQDPIPAELAHPARLPRVHATRQQGLEGELVDGIEADEDDLMGEDLEMEDNDDWIVDDNDGAIYKERAVTPNGEGGMREVGKHDRWRHALRMILIDKRRWQSPLQKHNHPFNLVRRHCAERSDTWVRTNLYVCPRVHFQLTWFSF
jgi:hypothetical protein